MDNDRSSHSVTSKITTDNFRLQFIKTRATNPCEGLQNLEYAYDAIGNVDWIIGLWTKRILARREPG